MIQQVKTSKIIWTLEWVDLEEPAFLADRCVLPSMVFVFRQGAAPPLGQELLAELDQRRAERLVNRLIADNGTPHRLFIAGADEWDEESWEAFGRDFGISITFYEEEDSRLPKAVIEARLGRDAAAATLRQRLAAETAKISAEHKLALAETLADAAAKIRSVRKRRAMLEQALTFNNLCPSALVGLGEAEMSNNDPDAALKFFSRILAQPHFLSETCSWDNPNSRLVLRAIYGQAMAYWHKGNLNDALLNLEELLARNPQDHQGARFFIPLLMQLSDLHTEAARWFAEYKKHYTGDFADPGLQFSWGLSLSMEEHEEEAFQHYRTGLLRNLYIAPQLLDLPDPPDDFWHPNDRSEPAYADEFCRSFGALWERDAAARRFLAECYERSQHDISTLIHIRRRITALQDQRYDPHHEEKWNALLTEEKALVEGTSQAT